MIPKELIKNTVISFILMTAFVLALFFSSQFNWVIFISFLIAIAAYEWAGFANLNPLARVVFGSVFLGACLGIIFYFPDALFQTMPEDRQDILRYFKPALWKLGVWLYFPALLGWALIILFWFPSNWQPNRTIQGKILLLLFSIPILLATWLAFIQLRSCSPRGLFMVSGMVWIAEFFAYHTGRLFNKHNIDNPGIARISIFGALWGLFSFYLLTTAVTNSHQTFDAMFFLRIVVDFFIILVLFITPLAMLGKKSNDFKNLLKRQAFTTEDDCIHRKSFCILDRIGSLMVILPLFTAIFLFFLVMLPD